MNFTRLDKEQLLAIGLDQPWDGHLISKDATARLRQEGLVEYADRSNTSPNVLTAKGKEVLFQLLLNPSEE